MGLLKGSVSYTKFFVQGEVPDDFRDRFLESIQLRAFTPLTPDEDAEERVGWCPFDAPYAPESGFDYNGVFYNQYLNLAFRADRWRFPGPVFRALFDKMAKAYLEKQGRKKLGKREKEELKALVAKKLRKQFSPAVQVVELSWDLNAGVCRFGHQSPKVHEHLHELFEKTFGLKLLASGPFADALNAGLPRACLDALERVEPATFHAVASLGRAPDPETPQEARTPWTCSPSSKAGAFSAASFSLGFGSRATCSAASSRPRASAPSSSPSRSKSRSSAAPRATKRAS